MLSDSARKQLLRFCAGESDAAAFEAWVCAAPDLETEVGHGPYLDLISADYQGRDAHGARDLCEQLLEQHHPGVLPRYRVAAILRSMRADDAALLTGLRKLVVLRNGDHQFEFIPIEFVGFESENELIPTPDRYHLWDPTFLAAKLASAKPYLAAIRKACEELLDDLRQQAPDVES
jgi:hypothetical protein